ncbi:ribonuclease P protein component [Croceitalea marina]|uniref:Ribonuclease P protein component n=1 Tax=Croceitalea marina TaxID=1775166 RepID=A0ABW5MYX8_9FLAO
MRNDIIPFNPKLKEYARVLRKNSTLSEVLLWEKIKNRNFKVQFHRQVPLLEYIVDFYCHELRLAIEIDGSSHQYQYEYDSKRQGELEKRGVVFIRFSDFDVKKNMFNVLLSLEEIINQHSKENIQKTSLKSPQGDNLIDSSFSKKEKLKSKKLIEQLFVEGKSINNFPLKLIYLKTDFEDNSHIKTGVIAPKKSFKKAVQRNRIKRLLREAYRLNKHLVFNNIEGDFAFMILYLGKETPTYDFVDTKMKGLLKKFKETVLHEKSL